MAKSVAHIFGGEGKVKIMRLFVFNPRQSFPAVEVAKRAKERPANARRELNILLKAGLVKKRARNFALNDSYPYLPAIENFLIDAAAMSDKEIVKALSKAGTLKLVLVSGVFIHEPESRVDLLVVGDNIRDSKLITAISAIEAELGIELRYAAFETADFNYRLSIYDKLIRDIIEFKHKMIVNKLGV